MKKCFSVLLSFVILFSASNVALASNSMIDGSREEKSLIGNVIGGEYVLTEEEYNEYLQSLSIEELEEIERKELVANSMQMARSGVEVTIPGTFTIYQQENSYYCLAATVKSILMYINGTSPNQISINLTIGMDSSLMPGYLNNRQSVNYYAYSMKPSYNSSDAMCSRLLSTISNHQVPTSIGISGTTTSRWYYDTTSMGHSVVVNGVNSDYSQILISDPLGGVIENCPSFYRKPAYLCFYYSHRIVW